MRNRDFFNMTRHQWAVYLTTNSLAWALVCLSTMSIAILATHWVSRRFEPDWITAWLIEPANLPTVLGIALSLIAVAAGAAVLQWRLGSAPARDHWAERPLSDDE